MDLLLLTRIPISKWGDFWLGASGNHKAERTKNSLNYSVRRSSLRNRTLQRTRWKDGSVAGNQLALIIMMDRIKLRCHFSRFISSSLLSKFINMKLKSLSSRTWGTSFFLHNLYEYQCLGKWKINSSYLVPRGVQAGFLCAALQLLLTCSTSTQFWARMQLPVHPNSASPDLFIHTALLLMQKAAYVITCSPSVDCPCSSADALESCLTLSHAIPVLLRHPSHHVQHLLILCTTLRLCLTPAALFPPVLHVSSTSCRPLAFILILPSNSYLKNAILDLHSASAEPTWVSHLGKYSHKGYTNVTNLILVYLKVDPWWPTGMIDTPWTSCHQSSPHLGEGRGCRQNVLFQFK